jgi:hypothetical protein
MTETKKRVRRTEEQLIADLAAEIERLKKRQQARKAKKSPAIKSTADAVRHIDAALKAVEDAAHKQALQEAREPLVAVLMLEGIAVPKPRGRKPKERQANREPARAAH